MNVKITRTAAAVGCALFLIFLMATCPLFAETEQRSVKGFDGVYASGPVQVFLMKTILENVVI